MTYPRKSVFLMFCLIGPLVGTVLLWLMFVLGSAHALNTEELWAALQLLLIFLLFGFFLGITPALLTGWFAVYFKLHRSIHDVTLITTMAYCITVLCCFILMMNDSDNTKYTALVYGGVGAISGLIMAMCVLPKKPV
jgi:hypothetical protein